MALPVKYFRFGPFELNSQTGELRKLGVKLRLPDQSCKVLLQLLEHPGELVSREDLQQSLWNGETFVDFEHGLNIAVRRLRQALGDGAATPRYIETLPRRGYRFISEVEVRKPDDGSRSSIPPRDSHVPVPASTAIRSAPGPAFRKWSLAIGVLAGVVTATVYFVFSARHSSEATPLTAVALTGYAGAQRCPSFAPDGERVAFSWNGESRSNFDIYVKQIGVPASLRITSDTRPDISSAWSPDGSMIAFMRLLDDQRAEVLVTPALAGGPERHVTELAAPFSLYEHLKLLAWSADNKWLVASSGRTPSAISGLILISVSTGEKRFLTSPPPQYDDLDPAFSPDMHWLAFVRQSGSLAGDLYVARLEPGPQIAQSPKRLTFDHRPIGSPVWTGKGDELIFARYSLVGRHSLWRVNASDPSRLRLLPVSAESATAVSISPRGHRLIYTREVRNTNIWSLALSAPKEPLRRALTKPKLLIASNREESTPSFSGDGQHIAFQSARSGWKEIWMADRSGSNIRQLTDLKGSVAGFPRWSPDQTKILLHSRQQSVAHLYLVHLPSLRATPLPYDSSDDYTASWSQDGRSIYFASRRSGEVQVWKVPAEGGTAIQMTRNGGSSPFESLDSKSLFYTKPDQPGIWSMSLSDGTERCAGPVSVAAAGTAFAPGRKGIYFIGQSRDRWSRDLAFFDFASQRITSLETIDLEIGLGLAISPDEREVLYSQVDHVDSDLMLVENFEE